MNRRLATLAAHPRRSKVAGLTLLELMVALVIGSLLIAGAITVFVQSRGTYRVNETAARLQEVARYALDTIEPDLRLAGFWGLTNDPVMIENHAAPDDVDEAEIAKNVDDNCGKNWVADVTHYVDGRDAEDTDGDGYDLTCEAEDPASWSDVLIIRRASAAITPLTNGRLQVQTNRSRGLIFKDGIRPAGFGAGNASQTRDLVVHAYYVQENAPSSNGLPQFQLRRQTLIFTNAGGVGKPAIEDVPILPGVEDLQVQFGIDITGDGNADSYVNPGDVPVGARVASAKIWLRIVAEEGEAGFTDDREYEYANIEAIKPNDSRRRVIVSKTIQIMNTRGNTSV